MGRSINFIIITTIIVIIKTKVQNYKVLEVTADGSKHRGWPMEDKEN